MKSKQPHILVLGADGMVGNCVQSYFQNKLHWCILGTSRKQRKKIFYLDVKTIEENFESILLRIEHVDFVINCIGALHTENRKTLQNINADFPEKLANLSEKYGFRIIHISSDGVFSETAGKVTERAIPIPETDYGKSKLFGEIISPNVLNVRTSFLGLQSSTKNSLLEWILKQKKNVTGYSNQVWTGCTTLQFAQFCEFLVLENNFNKIRSKTHVVHFSPLGPVTKKEILEIALRMVNRKLKIIEKKDYLITRELTTCYANIMNINSYSNDLTNALKLLLVFYKKI